ncbi:MAG TPA: sulfotransferase, partial [Candidatus Binatia bacterium]|nr:sulfotransferase [Candidatus Binatia bacterium]
KNPTFSGKIESLIETFPDARFVVCMRSPYETIPSLLKLMTRNWKAGRCPPARIEDSRRLLTEQSFHTYTYPFEALARHSETRWVAVDYRDLVDRPKRAVEQIYSALDLEMSAAYSAMLDAEERRAGTHRTEHVYSLGEFGIDRAEIRTRLADLFERYRWDDDVASA